MFLVCSHQKCNSSLTLRQTVRCRAAKEARSRQSASALNLSENFAPALSIRAPLRPFLGICDIEFIAGCDVLDTPLLGLIG
jgi:hypothetical protein